MKDDLDE